MAFDMRLPRCVSRRLRHASRCSSACAFAAVARYVTSHSRAIRESAT
jgi:hypothetical protein